MEPVNDPIIQGEWLARDVRYTSQYSYKTGLKKKYLYPLYQKESKYYKGRHGCRISLQRLCYGHWTGVKKMGLIHQGEMTLVGFSVAKASVPLKHGFELEPAASDKNPYHIHIYIKELDLPYPQPREVLDNILDTGLRRRLNEMRDEFQFLKLEDIPDTGFPDCNPLCQQCLQSQKP